MARGGGHGSRGERIRDKVDRNAAENRADDDYGDVRGGGLAPDKRGDGRERHRVHRGADHQEHERGPRRDALCNERRGDWNRRRRADVHREAHERHHRHRDPVAAVERVRKEVVRHKHRDESGHGESDGKRLCDGTEKPPVRLPEYRLDPARARSRLLDGNGRRVLSADGGDHRSAYDASKHGGDWTRDGEDGAKQSVGRKD